MGSQGVRHNLVTKPPLHTHTHTHTHTQTHTHDVVQSLSHVQLFATSWTVACQDSLSFTISQNLLKLMSIELMMPSSHLILCYPLLFLPSIFPASKSFPMSWLFAFSIGPSNEYSGVLSFRVVWFDLLVFQGTLKYLFQHHSFDFSILKTLGRSRHHFDIWLHSLHFSHDDFKYIEINF